MTNNQTLEPSSFKDSDAVVFYQDGKVMRKIAYSYRENYDHLIFEDGLFLRDMVFFKKELKTAISGRK